MNDDDDDDDIQLDREGDEMQISCSIIQRRSRTKLNSELCHCTRLFAVSFVSQCSLARWGRRVIGFPLASLKYRKFATWEREEGRVSERASERWSAILHFFAQSDFFARSICRFLCISGFTLPFPSLSLCLSSNVCSAGWGAKRVWLQLSLIQDGRMTLPFALLTVG